MKHKYKTARAAIMVAMAIQTLPVFAEQFEIPAQSAASALNIYAKQTNTALVYNYRDLARIETNALVGDFDSQMALQLLVEGTGLVVVKEGDMVTVQVSSKNDNSGSTSSINKVHDKYSDNKIEEMVVTATKRETTLQDTPMSISVLGEEEIEARGLINTEDFLRSVPGATYTEVVPGVSQITFRGLRTQAFEINTVGTYLGDVPTTFNSAITRTASDLKLVDIARIEVLRGPQGTLFGAGAMGGVVRSIPNDPDLNEFSGYLQAGLFGMSESDQTGNSQEGVINLPLINDKLALRVAAYRYDNPGFGDYVSTPEYQVTATAFGYPLKTGKDVNGSIIEGVRSSLLWQASENLSVKWTLGYQKNEGASWLGSDANATAIGSYTNYTLDVSSLTGDSKDFVTGELLFNNLVVDYDLGWGSVTSSTTLTTSDYSEAFVGTIVYVDVSDPSKDLLTHETRFASSFDGPLQFVGGIYYNEYEENTGLSAYITTNAFGGYTGPTDPQRQYIVRTTKEDLKEFALFGEVEYSFSEEWTFVVGARWFDYTRDDAYFIGENDFQRFPWDGGVNTAVRSLITTDESSTNFKATLRYQPSDEVMLYANWAQGFRLGTGQALPSAGLCDVDNDGVLDGTDVAFNPEIGSDNIDNYELGAKLDLLDSKLQVNLAVYQNNWEDIPVSVFGQTSACTNSITVNAGNAETRGFEIESFYYVTPDLTLIAGVGYNDSELLDSLIGTKGDRLPVMPEYNGNVALAYTFELFGYPASVRSDYSFAAGAYSEVRRVYPESDSYGQWDLRANIDFDDITLTVYGKNLTGEDAILGYYNGGVGYATRLLPRSYGVDVRYHF